MNVEQLRNLLDKYGQSQILRFFDSLSESEKKKLEAQIDSVKWDEISELIETHVKNVPDIKIPEDIQPAPFFPLYPKDEKQKEYYSKAFATGVELIKSGKVALLTVAGGQGTRLGFDGPKGTFPITPVKSKSLFQYFAESVLRLNEKYNCNLSWYVMTSHLNREATEDFFRKNNFFGLNPEKVTFFVQGTMPAISFSGKLLLAARDSLALSPNGHGGIFRALKDTGTLDMMDERGEEYLSYFQVDNPLVTLADPLFLGLHILENSEMSSRMLPKKGPKEKLGNFCIVDGKLTIIEYSDLPDELAHATNPDGSLKFLAGSPAIHVISKSFIKKLTSLRDFKLPWHRAEKKVPYIDDNGNLVKPESPNAVKLEMFIFDALPMAEKAIILEADRASEFAPVKNATGQDSAESCRKMLITRDALRLKNAGMAVPFKDQYTPDCVIEISPRVIIDDEDAVSYVKTKELQGSLPVITSGEEVYIDEEIKS